MIIKNALKGIAIALKLIKAITLLICLSLILGGIASAQKKQPTGNKIKLMTPAEIIFELESLLKTANSCNQLFLIASIAPATLAIGDTEKAKTYAQTLVTQAKTVSKNCDSGKAIHVGNLVLGRIALASGNITEAKFRLLEAGKTPGSAALNSFGPNMLLAKELLEKNERAVVLEYFELCAKFWKPEVSQLNTWKAQVKKGKIPDFDSNLRLGLEPTIDAEMMDIIRKILKTENPPN